MGSFGGLNPNLKTLFPWPFWLWTNLPFIVVAD